MTEALPKGIVLNTESISSEIENIGGVDVEDVAKLWRVYTANRSTMREDEGRRLENLFWRIWSSGRISRTIQGSTLATLFLHISEGESITRTGLGRLREISQSIPRIPPSRRSPASSTTSSQQPQGSTRTTSFPSSSRNVSRKPSANAPRVLPPPILKKPRQPTGDSQNGTRANNAGIPGETGIIPYISASPSPGQETSTGGSASERPRKKKTTFAKDPTLMEGADGASVKKRASQQSSTLSSVRHSPVAALSGGSLDSPDIYSPTSRRQKNPLPDESAISISPTPTYTNPSPWLSSTSNRTAPNLSPTAHPAVNITTPRLSDAQQIAEQLNRNQEIPASRSPTKQETQEYHQPSTASLVEKGFRTRFVEKRLQESRTSSFTNLGSSLLTRGGGDPCSSSRNSANTEIMSPGGGPTSSPGTIKGFTITGSQERESQLSTIQRGQQKQPTSQYNTTANGKGEGEEEIENEDAPSDRTAVKKVSQPPSPQPLPSIDSQQSQLSELIERERRFSAAMQKYRPDKS
ncbi:hypothetical protein FQN50_008896 [Emmonsiellopsis sp. PD_5]|nr:hypothetical protein FQN50_008896 [Emmonsiellopsis sp. PD_5]